MQTKGGVPVGEERIDGRKKTVICRSCSAEFDAAMPNCPYCGTMNLPGAETAYMNKLEGIRGDLEGLGALGRKETKAHLSRMSKRLLIAAAVLALAVIAVLAVLLHRERREAAQEQAEFLWQREGFAQMDRYYDAGAYEELAAYYDKASDEGHRVWQYRHWTFCEYYGMILTAQNTLRAWETEGGSQLFLFMDEIGLYRLETLNGLDEGERALLESLRQPLLEDFHGRFDLTEEELNGFRRMLEQDGYVSIGACEQFFKERGWEA